MIINEISPDIIALTETWLNENIADSVCDLTDYSTVRKDRMSGSGGGILLYVRKGLYFKQLYEPLVVNGSDFEILFVSVRPHILPRPLSVVIIVLLYCPPWYNAVKCKQLCDFISDSYDRILRHFPNAAFILMGDFNHLNTSLFNRHLGLKQLITKPTRGRNILDKFFTNISAYFKEPLILPPIGKSDHNCIFIKSDTSNRKSNSKRTVYRRRLNDTVIDQIGMDLYRFNWAEFFSIDNCQQQANMFYSVVHDIINAHAPLIKLKYKSNDKPWINDYFKRLIERRNAAFNSGSLVLYKKLRNQVHRVNKSLKTQYYINKVDCLKNGNNARSWWKHVKALSGTLDLKNGTEFLDLITRNGELIAADELPNVLNDFFISVSDHILPLNDNILNELRAQLPDVQSDDFIVSELSVFNALQKLKVHKASCDDLLSNRLLTSLSDVLAAPICSLINSSIRQGYVPTQWKIARVVPIPKIHPPVAIETDLRPISITSGIAKIAESFISDAFNMHFNNLSDPDQFGCSANRSTTHALLKFSHLCFGSSDNCRNIIRVLFIDFRKAFDMVDHNILYKKFVQYHFPPHITTWLLSFLHNRSQFVSLGHNNSFKRFLNAGTPQGTLTGPNQFKLLVNDLSFVSPYIKYVDDTSVLTISEDPHNPALQEASDSLSDWCEESGMVPNPKKCKEMVIYFGKKYSNDDIPLLTVGGQRIERVFSFKLLGVIFSSDLSWDKHVTYILNKVSKRYFVIYQLTKIGLPSREILVIYCSIIRSVLEYACPVWHSGLTKSQSNDIERVQRRCFKIIYPDLSYREALSISGLDKLSVRRENIARNLFTDIKNPTHVLHGLLNF